MITDALYLPSLHCWNKGNVFSPGISHMFSVMIKDLHIMSSYSKYKMFDIEDK